MRIPEYLSPSSIDLFVKDRELFYKKYLSENEEVRAEARFAQTMPMSIGSSFDAYVKSYLYIKLFGSEKAVAEGYDLATIFKDQVEDRELDHIEQSVFNPSGHCDLRSWAWEHGRLLFEEYKALGCLRDLVDSFTGCVGKPRFEFSIKDTISIGAEEVPLLGKPDIFYTSEHGKRVILDWKVNGYCNSRLTSPMKGYTKLRESISNPKNKGHRAIKETIHKDCCLMNVGGVEINVAQKLEDGNKSWADQLSIYSWLLGEPVGSEAMIVGIDQICGGPIKDITLDTKELGNRRLRFATHRLKLGAEYQKNLAALIKDIWTKISDEWIFDHLSKADSLARCQLLDDRGGKELW